MQKPPSRRRPAAALDNPQLALPLNLPSEPRPPSAVPLPAVPTVLATPAAAMPATLRGDIGPADTTETSSTPTPPLRAPDATRNRQLVPGSQMPDYGLTLPSRR